jgi:transcription antitermination factor NusG
LCALGCCKPALRLGPPPAKVTVLVSFFGRETPVQLDFLQVEKV